MVEVRSELHDSIRNRAPVLIGGSSDTKNSFHGLIDEVRFHKWPLTRPELVEAPKRMLRDLLKKRIASERQATFLSRYFRDYVHPATMSLRKEIATLKRDRELLTPRLRVMRDVNDRRPSHVLVRGDFRSPGEEVRPDVPAMLHSLPPKRHASDEYSRLDLANWLVAPQNRLTARVIANRLWAQLFGRGIVATLDDFGAQGEPASHPELLDYLAGELKRSQWDVKSLVREIVTSATYRQSSVASKRAWENDPNNILLARGPRRRLSAEALRDNALSISGLLSNRIGGPSVRPYQPAGLWREMSRGDEEIKTYEPSRGEDLYRRGIYTFWKRSIHYPAFAVFDAPSREVCVSSRPITNTPTQALAILNDPTFVECARAFASTIIKHEKDLADRIQFAFRHALGRDASLDELHLLKTVHQDLRANYQENCDAALRLIGVGESRTDASIDVVVLATWTAVAQIVLTMDETITKE